MGGVEVRLGGGEVGESCVEGLGESGDVGVDFLEGAEGGAVGEKGREGGVGGRKRRWDREDRLVSFFVGKNLGESCPRDL